MKFRREIKEGFVGLVKLRENQRIANRKKAQNNIKHELKRI